MNLTLQKAGVLGAGVIGASWTALLLARGIPTTVYDVDPNVETKVRSYVEAAWSALTELGLTEHGTPDAVHFTSDPRDAVAGAGFIQESVPERLPIKMELFQAIEPVVATDAVVASSASGLTLDEMQTGWARPSRFILGHPFNPPHLIPLVELMANEKTDGDVLPRAEEIYAALGKITIRVNKAVPGHVANRLQAALWQEAISLVMEGVASVEDVDKAVWSGPGLRWAAMGPTQLFHLGAFNKGSNEGGLGLFMDRFGPSFHRWWEDLGSVRLEGDTAKALLEGVEAQSAGRSADALSAERDALITAMLKVTANLRG